MPVSKIIFAIGFASLIIGLAHAIRPLLALEQASCPDQSAGEKPEDCPWAGAARTLIAEAEAGRTVSPALQTLLPRLYAQIKTDGEKPELKDLWGQSINFDENAKGIIVHPGIIQSLAELFGVPAPQGESRVVHAGMEHTYGYLFSILKTPYGFKRARWVQGEIEEGFNLPLGTLGPTPAEGSLFMNVTTFIGTIAFRTEANEFQVIRKATRNAAREIRRMKFSELKPIRLEERVEAANANGKVRTVKLFTDFVPFLNQANPKGNTHLLIYTVKDPFHHSAQLISAFPVQTGFVQRAIQPSNLGKGRPIITRYNAFVEGLSGSTKTGERKVTSGMEIPQL
ncbi:MAG: hypothetical protein A2Z97_10345 [Bdellovibrionales bacterium GWB1_52_6]|nr:MAG: hypothetical protein A2Z97_10345 [Bdellovibrionales bacterium GWB1_52_6]